jgi:hypothetical protein
MPRPSLTDLLLDICMMPLQDEKWVTTLASDWAFLRLG